MTIPTFNKHTYCQQFSPQVIVIYHAQSRESILPQPSTILRASAFTSPGIVYIYHINTPLGRTDTTNDVL